MADIFTNIGAHGLGEGLVETAKDIFGKGQYQEKATFKVTDKNGEVNEVQNSAAGPIYLTPSGGYSNTRSYAYLTNGTNGKLTLNVSRDLYESDSFKANFLDNSTFKEVLKSYNSNKNADTVIPVTRKDGTTENMKFSELVENYNKALSEFASDYENYSVIRDNVRNNTGFDLTDDEIRIASNTITDKDKKSDTKIIYLPDEWLNIYDFTKMNSFDKDSRTVSAKDFFDAYNLDKDGGINEEAWNEMVASANGVVANAYAYSDDDKEYSMKKNVEEDANGSEEAMAKAKDRLVRSMQASNLLAGHDPEQNFIHTVGIVASNLVLEFGKNVLTFMTNCMSAEAGVIDSIHYGIDLGVAQISDINAERTVLQGAAAEDLESGVVNTSNYREYIDGILVSSTDGSMSEVERVKAEWEAKMKSTQDLVGLVGDSDYNKVLATIDAVNWHEQYTAQIAPYAAKAGKIISFAVYTALEIAAANKMGGGIGKAIYVPEAAAKSALTTAFGKGTSIGARLKALGTFATRNKLVSGAMNMSVQSVIDTLAFEDPREFNDAWRLLAPGERHDINETLAENFVNNSIAEIIGITSSGVGGLITKSDNKAIKFASTRMQRAAARISLPKKKAQLAFANTKIAKFLSKPIGKNARAAADFAIKSMNESPNAIFKSGTLEEYNIEKFRMEYEATKNIAKAKKGNEYVTNFEKNKKAIAATTTEAIEGKINEKNRFLMESARISEGVKSYVNEILADYGVRTSFKEVNDASEELQKTLKWEGYNPAKNRRLSQDASNYVVNKSHYDDLMRKKAILEAEGKALSAGEAKKLAELEAWLGGFAARNGAAAVQALDEFIPKQQAFNKATTDWMVRHGVMSQAKYDSLANTGFFGSEDQFYVRAIALPDGKSMEDLDDVYGDVVFGSDRDFLHNTGYDSSVRDVNMTTEWDLHLSNKVGTNYLDPILANALTLQSMAKAYQGKMWANTLNAIKAPVQVIDTEGKPVSKREVNGIINSAKNAAADAIKDLSADDLTKNLEDGTSLGKSYLESSSDYYKKDIKTGKVEKVNKVERAKKAVRSKLGIGSDKSVITNTKKLSKKQTDSVIASLGDNAPEYSKVNNVEDLKAQFETLSARQQEQALKYMGVKTLDDPNAVQAWNKSCTDDSMIDDLNKTYIQERVAPEEGGPEKLPDASRTLLESYIADNTKASFEFDPKSEKVMAMTPEQRGKALRSAVDRKKKYEEAVKDLKDAEDMVKRVESGTDPFTLNAKSLTNEIISTVAFKLKNNKVAETLLAQARALGIEDDTLLRYYALSSMVEIGPDGTAALSEKFKKAFKEKYVKRATSTSINAEGNLSAASIKEVQKKALDIIEEKVLAEWRQSQAFLADAGASELLDTEKMFNAIGGELSKFSDELKNNRNIVQILNAKGEYEFVQVDPVVADLYRSRPYVIRGEDSFLRKMSRLSRLGNTTFNMKSVANQYFKDTIQSIVMAGLSHTIGTYAKEIAEVLGDECVKYLQESFGENGWNKFSEGLSEEELKLKAAEYMTSGPMGASLFADNLTESRLFQKGNMPESFSDQVKSAASEAREYMGYSKKKGLADKKKAKKGFLSWAEDHAPGNYLNNMRETYLRKANYTAAFNDALKRGQTIDQARATAEVVSRNATTNFQNTFMWGNYICDNVPFLSAAINGSASFWRLFEMDPLGVLTRLNALGMYVMAQTINSGQRFEDRQTLKNTPDWIKRENMVFIYDGTPFKIPMPEEVSIFMAPYRQAAEKMLGSENRSWIELLYNDALEISPIDLDGFSTEDQTALTKNEGLMSRLSREAQVLLSQCSPPLFQTVLMAITKVDPYTGNPINEDYVYYDDEGNRQTMNYVESESSKALAKISDEFGWGIGAAGAEKLIEKAIGTGGRQFLDGLTGLYEAFAGKDMDGNKISAGEALLRTPEQVAEKTATAVVVEDYQIQDKYDSDFKSIITQLESEKKQLLTPGSKYQDFVAQLGKLSTDDSNYDTKKTNLTRQALQEIENFRNKAMTAVKTYYNHYGSDYDGKKFASVVALLNFDTPTVIPTTALDFERAHEQYYRGRQDAYQTMIDMGFPSTEGMSILGVTKRNAQTGEIYTKYFSPVAILNASNAVFNNMAESVNAEIAAALKVAGIDRKEMFDGYYKAKAQGSAAAKEYKKNWNAKIVKAIAPTVDQYGAKEVVENSLVQDYLDNYLFISNPWKTEDYLKEIFEVEDKK